MLEDFVRTCKEHPQQVVLIGKVQEDAARDFNLKTKADLLGFIGNGGLESPAFVNTKDWENNPQPKTPIKVDAYEFSSAFTLGYIAFMYNPRTQKWIIKSFKLSQNRETANALEIALRNAGLLPPKQGESNE